MSYNGIISEYDNILLSEINLTITTTGGFVDKSVVGPDETVKFIPNDIGIKRVTAQIENASQTIEFLMGNFNMLQGVIYNANSSVINLTRNFTYNPWDTMTEGVLIDRNVTINGNGFTIDAKGKSRIFKVTAGSINITNVTLKNGNAGNGGAIYFSNAISNSNINAIYINNTANINGGANHFESSVSNSNITGTYTNNTAKYGGANHFESSVSNSNITGTYTNNHADHGGANHLLSSVSNSTIYGTYNHNTANINGGANHFNNEVSNSTIYGTYTNNKANGWDPFTGGGANHFYSVSNSTIYGTYTNNKATNDGGAIYFSREVSNSTIAGIYTYNTAKYGGAIHFNLKLLHSKVGGTYINNIASGDAIIYFSSYYSFNAEITDVIFLNNTASEAIIYFGSYNSFNTEITDAIFLNNKCGYGIYARTSGVEVKDSWFGNNASNYMNRPNNYNVQMDRWLFLNGTNNQNDIKFFLMSYNGTTSEYDNTLLPEINLTITTTGGIVDKSVVCLDETVKFSVTESGIKRVTAQIENASQTIEFSMGDFDILQEVINSANSSVINLTRNYTYDQWDTMTEGVLIDRNVTINGNGFMIDAKGKSRIFKVTAESINITDVTFKNGKAYEGGAIYFENAISNSNINATYTNNTARNGGANYFNGAVNNVNLSGNFTGNCVKVNGGANYFKNTVTDAIFTCNFTNNTAGYNAGANFFYKMLNNVALTGNFTNNIAEMGQGGANVFIDSVNNSILTCDFTGNRAKENGGANFFVYKSINIILAGIFTGNSVEMSGGANYFEFAVTNITLTCDFINNTAKWDGGANCFNGKLTNATLTGNFTGNCAEDSGGANFFSIEVTDVNLTGEFNNNSARNDGGANCFDESVTNVALTGNYINNTGSNVIHIGYSVSGNVIRDSIFLNNGPINVTKGNITAVDNWFGNNVTDYDVEPDVGIDLDNWLFINGTANPNPVSVVDTVDVIFKLSRYGGENVTEYDNSRLLPINLTVTSTLGSVNPNMIHLNESIAYASNSEGNGTVTAKIENTRYTIQIMVIKENPSLSIGSQEVTYSNNTVIALNYNSNATGKVNISLNGKKSNYTFADLDLNGTISLGDVGVDMYGVIVVYSGDDNFLNATATGNLTVNKATAEIILVNETLELYVGNFVSDFAYLTPVDAGNLTYNLSNPSIVKIEEGKIIALKEGNTIITVSFKGDEKYLPAENKTINVTVSLNDARVTVDNDTLDLKVDETYKINATKHPDTILLNITYTSSDESVATVDKNGVVTAHGEGTAIITLEVGDDEIYAKNSTTVTVTVSKIPTEINIDNATLTLNFGDDVSTGAALNPEKAGNLTYKSDNEGIAIVKDGKIIALKEGNAIITVSFKGDNKYAAAENKTINVAVKKLNPIMDVSAEDITEGENATISVTLPDDATGNLITKVNGNTYSSPVENGKAVITIPYLEHGNYTLPVTYSGDDKYNLIEISVNVTVNPQPVPPKKNLTIIAIANPITVGEDATIVLTGFEDATGNVGVGVNGKSYVVPILKGAASVTVSGLTRNVTAVVSYAGDGASASVVIVVNPKPKENATISIDAPAEVTEGDSVTVTVTLPKDATGTVTIGNEVVPVQNGTASAVLTNLSVGDNTVSVAYSGDDKYNSIETSVVVTVDEKPVPPKENLTIIASADPITVGDNATIVVTGLKDATGNVMLLLMVKVMLFLL